MRRFLFTLVGLLFAWTPQVWAQLRLVEWHNKTTLAPLILAVRENETPEQASERYLKSIALNSDLLELFDGRPPVIETIGFKEINPRERGEKALLEANLPKDYNSTSARIRQFKNHFKYSNHTSYILLISGDITLTLKEKKEYYKAVHDNFGLLVLMGGEDVSPDVAKQEHHHSNYSNRTRDESTTRLVRAYDSYGGGFIYGVCRGLQITAVAFGYKLIQDVPKQIGEAIAHSEAWHKIKVLATQGFINPLAALAEKYDMSVLSRHHQSVIWKPGGLLQILALSADGVVEALGWARGMLFQFHNEDMNNHLGFEMTRKVIEDKNAVVTRHRVLTCEGALKP